MADSLIHGHGLVQDEGNTHVSWRNGTEERRRTTRTTPGCGGTPSSSRGTASSTRNCFSMGSPRLSASGDAQHSTSRKAIGRTTANAVGSKNLNHSAVLPAQAFAGRAGRPQLAAGSNQDAGALGETETAGPSPARVVGKRSKSNDLGWTVNEIPSTPGFSCGRWMGIVRLRLTWLRSKGRSSPSPLPFSPLRLPTPSPPRSTR